MSDFLCIAAEESFAERRTRATWPFSSSPPAPANPRPARPLLPLVNGRRAGRMRPRAHALLHISRVSHPGGVSTHHFKSGRGPADCLPACVRAFFRIMPGGNSLVDPRHFDSWFEVLTLPFQDFSVGFTFRVSHGSKCQHELMEST